MGQRSYQCPGTSLYPEHTFRYFHHPSIEADPVPRFCPTCGYDSQAEDDPPFQREVTAPHIATIAGKAGDQVYRMMEGQAEERIQMAAEMTGQPASDFADMKITDMKDGIRPGDIAAVELPPSPVSERMAQMEARGIPVGFSGAGAAFAAEAHTGILPHAGLAAAQQVKQHFQTHAQAVMRSGESGRF